LRPSGLFEGNRGLILRILAQLEGDAENPKGKPKKGGK
jgi:hypothetical protein